MSDRTANPHPMDSLFARLALAYGHKWVRMWDGFRVSDVKDEWARRLAPFTTPVGLDAIEWVLDNKLPTEWPPTALEFAALVKAAMPAEVPARLTEVRTANPTRARDLLARLRAWAAPSRSCTAWAEALLARQQAGERLSLAQREAVHHLSRKTCLGMSTTVQGVADRGA